MGKFDNTKFCCEGCSFRGEDKKAVAVYYKSWSSTCIYCTSLGPVHALWNLQTSYMYMPNDYFYQHLLNGSTKQATIAVHTCTVHVLHTQRRRDTIIEHVNSLCSQRNRAESDME